MLHHLFPNLRMQYLWFPNLKMLYLRFTNLHMLYLRFPNLQMLYLILNRPGVAGAVLQLDGVGPVDNRPSTD